MYELPVIETDVLRIKFSRKFTFFNIVMEMNRRFFNAARTMSLLRCHDDIILYYACDFSTQTNHNFNLTNKHSKARLVSVSIYSFILSIATFLHCFLKLLNIFFSALDFSVQHSQVFGQFLHLALDFFKLLHLTEKFTTLLRKHCGSLHCRDFRYSNAVEKFEGINRF